MDEYNEMFSSGIRENDLPCAKIAVVGVGGGGGNAVNRICKQFTGVDFIAINTDLQDLQNSNVPFRLEIGQNTTNGKGAGANPEVGQQAAEESRELIRVYLQKADLVIITAGLGKGTGTGASPIVASIAKEMGKLVIAVVTTPFYLEGKPRRINADIGIENLAKVVDSYIVVSNDHLVSTSKNEPIGDAFKIADGVLSQCILGISDVIINNQTMNLDFADLTTIFKGMGRAYLGIGAGHGENRVLSAIKQAVGNTLQNTTISKATSVLLYIKATSVVTLGEVDQASSLVRETVDKDANIIFGIDLNANISNGNEVEIMIIATGFNKKQDKPVPAPVPEKRTNPTVFSTPNVPQQKSAEAQESPFSNTRVSVSEEADDDDVPVWIKLANKKTN